MHVKQLAQCSASERKIIPLGANAVCLAPGPGLRRTQAQRVPGHPVMEWHSQDLETGGHQPCALSHAVPSVRTAIPHLICLGNASLSFRTLSQCYLLQEAFSDLPSLSEGLSSGHSYPLSWHFSLASSMPACELLEAGTRST